MVLGKKMTKEDKWDVNGQELVLKMAILECQQKYKGHITMS